MNNKLLAYWAAIVTAAFTAAKEIKDEELYDFCVSLLILITVILAIHQILKEQSREGRWGRK